MITFDEFKRLAKKANLIPIYKEIAADQDTPVSAFLKVRSGEHDFLLESVEGGERWGRFSFIGSRPAAIFRSRGRRVEIIERGRRRSSLTKSDPLIELKRYLSKYRPVVRESLPRFFGGAVGYLGYDMVRFFEKLPAKSTDDLRLYDSYFMITDTVVLFDNLRQVIILVANVHVHQEGNLRKIYDEAVGKIEGLVEMLRKPLPQSMQPASKKNQGGRGVLKAIHTEAAFCQMVHKAQEYIKSGDVFQAVLSTSFEGSTPVSPFELYRSIRRINPSPYLYFLHLGDVSIVGASPEVMVRFEDGKVELRPIAGTRRRGRDEKEDGLMEEELRGDPKERAEHIMLVDLGRNDLGRVCEVGTVHVDEQEVIERYSHVMHLVSHVSGRVRSGCDAFDVIRATFPAGTLSGAPKIRAMEIIEELEGRRRGIYGGCVGYISFTGNLDTAITIRTALFRKKKVYVQAGAGIVYNSIPKREYLECKNKAMGMIKALESIT